MNHIDPTLFVAFLVALALVLAVPVGRGPWM